MKLVPTNINELGCITRPYSQNYKMLCEFRDSTYRCVEIEDYTQKSAKVCATSFANSIKRYRMKNIKAICRGTQVYLIKVKP